jgi:GT2 family glycosyltransferase
MLDLSIIIVSFNTLDLTVKCLESVFKYTKGISFEVIVVDNASDDKSASEIKRKFRTKVNVIRNKENVGFGAANNQAMEIAAGRYFCLLNSDTVLIGNVFDRMIEWFDQNTFLPIKSSRRIRPGSFSMDSIPSGTLKRLPIGLIGCKLLNSDRTEQYSIRTFPTLSQIFKELFFSRLMRKSMPSKITEVDYVMGACMLLKREVYERVGGFDPNIFMYVEETDWCYRIRSHAFSVVYWPDAAIIHYGGQSSPSGRKGQILNLFKSYQYFYKKHFGEKQLKRLQFLLRLKCYLMLVLGRILRNNYLLSTYSEALNIVK